MVSEPGDGQGRARHVGALATTGDWLAFVDADTVVRPNYTRRLLAFVRERDLAGAGSRCRVAGGWRTRPFELLFNHGLSRLSPPPLPGFNVFVNRAAYFDVGGFRSGPNEDVTFSRRLGPASPDRRLPGGAGRDIGSPDGRGPPLDARPLHPHGGPAAGRGTNT